MFQTIDHPGKSRKGFLWQLLTELCAIHSQSSQSAGTQTDLIKVATISTLGKFTILLCMFTIVKMELVLTGF